MKFRRRQRRGKHPINLSTMEPIECAGFVFFSNFDSGNLAKVELVNRKETRPPKANSLSDEPEVEFNLWTKPDCAGTDFENLNRTWFHFGVKGGVVHALVKINLVDINKQAKMYSQGMAPVTRTVPGRPQWERIRDRVSYTSDEPIFTLSFRYFTPDHHRTTTYFAFTYPYTYNELQTHLYNIDSKYLTIPGPAHIDDIYYVRECVCKSIEGRRIDLITISSYHNITFEKEPRLSHLFKDETVNRPFKFHDKKVIFVSARVHPGETPSSYVFNGFLHLLLNRDDLFALALRRMYVFKLIPFLNPDGVVRGHYRTDTKGVNLNRLYLNPSLPEHPSVYAARSIIRYHHFGTEVPDSDLFENHASSESSIRLTKNFSKSSRDLVPAPKLSDIFCTKCKRRIGKLDIDVSGLSSFISNKETRVQDVCQNCFEALNSTPPLPRGEIALTKKERDAVALEERKLLTNESGLFLYIDLHGHASKKGIFMYGNHFENDDLNVECMLLPRIMSINNQNFHFHACNFTERNMYLKDRRDGMSREGSGRVAVLKLTGLIRSYTLECNYNTGRLVNPVPPTVREGSNKYIPALSVPPKFTPHTFEEVGKALGPSILDLTEDNPNTRLPHSEFKSITNMREWLRYYLVGQYGNRPSATSCKSYTQIQRPNKVSPKRLPVKSLCKLDSRTYSPLDRKENIGGLNNKSLAVSPQPCCSSSLFRQPIPTSKSSGRSKFTAATISSNLKSKEIIHKLKQIDTSLSDQKLTRTSPVRKDKIGKSTATTVVTRLPPEGEVVAKQESKRIKISPVSTRRQMSEENRMKLREICVVKSGFGKKMIAKYDDPTGSTEDEDLVIAWTNDRSAEVLPMKQPLKRPSQLAPRITTKPRIPSPMKSIVKTNISSSFKKVRAKQPLRRLASATETNFRINKKNKKRKKTKSKFV